MKTTKYIFILISAILLANCTDDFLNKKKLGSLTTENFFLSENDAYQSLVAA